MNEQICQKKRRDINAHLEVGQLGDPSYEARWESGKEHALEGLGLFQRLVRWKTRGISYGTHIYTHYVHM